MQWVQAKFFSVVMRSKDGGSKVLPAATLQSVTTENSNFHRRESFKSLSETRRRSRLAGKYLEGGIHDSFQSTVPSIRLDTRRKTTNALVTILDRPADFKPGPSEKENSGC